MWPPSGADVIVRAYTHTHTRANGGMEELSFLSAQSSWRGEFVDVCVRVEISPTLRQRDMNFDIKNPSASKYKSRMKIMEWKKRVTTLDKENRIADEVGSSFHHMFECCSAPREALGLIKSLPSFSSPWSSKALRMEILRASPWHAEPKHVEILHETFDLLENSLSRTVLLSCAFASLNVRKGKNYVIINL